MLIVAAAGGLGSGQATVQDRIAAYTRKGSRKLSAPAAPESHGVAAQAVGVAAKALESLGIALEGVRLISAHLERAVRDGTDVDARAGMLMASMMGAVAFQKGLGLVHSCAHALGTALGVHHGLANGLMLDHALAFNVPVSADRLARLAVAPARPMPHPRDSCGGSAT